MPMEVPTRKPKILRCISWNSFFKVAQIVLRILATGFAVASIATMLTSNQEIDMRYYVDYIVVAKAHYTYSSALRYKVLVDVGVCAFSLLSLVVVYKMTRWSNSEAETSFYFYLLIVDGVMMVVAISACAAATAIGLVALEGVNKPGISWAPICPLAGKFCLKVALSIASSYAAFACLAALTFISACKLKLLATN